jgi:lactate permease
MMYLIWTAPAIAVVLMIASGRFSTSVAAFAGVILASVIALVSAPVAYGVTGMAESLARGTWIGWTIAPYIFGGLLFWNVASAKSAGTQVTLDYLATDTPLAQRKLLFFACFLIGPFAEAATGFGVGMLSTILLIRRLPIPSASYLMTFSLLSQTMVPWGGMASGTLLGATYARTPATTLALYSIIPVFALMCVWLPLFWRTARQAGMGASWQECAKEAGWLVVAFIFLAGATALLGPEISLLAAYGPLIVIRFWMDQRPDMTQIRQVMRRVLPYACLISALVLSRLIAPVSDFLSHFLPVQPFDNLPAWAPLFHAGSWLLLAAVVTAVLRKRVQFLSAEIKSSWQSAQAAIVSVFLFAMMAEILSGAGISQTFANGMFAVMQQSMVLLTPVLSGGFGILTNSGSAANSLFMTSQLYFAAEAGLSVPLVIALQHVSGCAMSMFSPVRMAIAASLNKAPGHERATYAMMLPYAAGGMAVLFLFAIWIMLL